MKIIALEEGLVLCEPGYGIGVSPHVRCANGVGATSKRAWRMMVVQSASRSVTRPSDPVSESLGRLKRSAGFYWEYLNR